MNGINLDLAECAKINFENFERAFPVAKAHPYYIFAKAQLDEALGYGTVEEILKREQKKATNGTLPTPS